MIAITRARIGGQQAAEAGQQCAKQRNGTRNPSLCGQDIHGQSLLPLVTRCTTIRAGTRARRCPAPGSSNKNPGVSSVRPIMRKTTLPVFGVREGPDEPYPRSLKQSSTLPITRILSGSSSELPPWRAHVEADSGGLARFSDVNLSKALVFAREPGATSGSRLPAMPALASVGNRTLVRHALDWLDGSAIREVAIVTPADAAGDDPARARTRRRLGLRDALARADAAASASPSRSPRWRDFLDDEPFVLHLADSLSKQDLGSLVGSDATADDEALLVVQEAAVTRRRGDRPGRAPQRRQTAGHVCCGASAGVAVIGPGDGPGGRGARRLPPRGPRGARHARARARWARQHPYRQTLVALSHRRRSAARGQPLRARGHQLRLRAAPRSRTRTSRGR